ncbi:hypothetical protein HK098_000336 [Nowakowskiella sp. JEL0407]|nr:hypothetical protein HK098_000336 [Nowakowskiella sp. JEL0407]
MQPKTAMEGSNGDLLVSGGRKKRALVVKDEGKNVLLDDLPVNSEEMVSRDKDSVPVDELFFHTYFQKKKQSEAPRKRKRTSEFDDIEQDEELDEDEVWNAIQKSSGFSKDLEGEENEDDESDGMEAFDAMMREGMDDDDDDEDMDDNDDMDKVFGDSMGGEEEDVDDDDDGFEDIEEGEDVSDNSDDEVEDMAFASESEDEKPVAKRSSSKTLERLQKTAKSLGYSGDFFGVGSSGGDFASADDFAELLDQGVRDGHDDDEDEDQTKKKGKKRNGGLKAKKSLKKRK